MVGLGHLCNNISATARTIAENCWRLLPAAFCNFLRFPPLLSRGAAATRTPPNKRLRRVPE
eukprot:5907089-Alexandrium_andersonii.AAC.1